MKIQIRDKNKIFVKKYIKSNLWNILYGFSLEQPFSNLISFCTLTKEAQELLRSDFEIY